MNITLPATLLALSLVGPAALAAPGPAPAQSHPPVSAAATSPLERLSAAALLTRAQAASGLPAEGLRVLHERTQTSGLRGSSPTSSLQLSEAWLDLSGQRLRLTNWRGDTLDSVQVLTPGRAQLYTPQGGVVPVPRQRAAELRQTNLHAGLAGLSSAAQPGVRLQVAGMQTWLDTETLTLRGLALEATWPDSSAQRFLLDPQTGRLLADRPGKKKGDANCKDCDEGLIIYYGEVSAGRRGNETAKAPAPAAQTPRTGSVRTLLWSDGDVLARQQVVLELNPALPAATFEVPR
ncbi:hypothetical protein [Deinococcus sp. Marseille-Q6407]|uniref:hypothetical protein n=1 Tax=Deinococcus sp. Marseille-Q6407 TaxID=2969223 RepID=UPI0021BF0649|nr:hypothetical protein [Deinococcus sp. Marseille-Q6407]